MFVNKKKVKMTILNYIKLIIVIKQTFKVLNLNLHLSEWGFIVF